MSPMRRRFVRGNVPWEDSTLVSGICPHGPTRAWDFDHENEDNGQWKRAGI
jgi:hypothetical protein